MTNGRAFLAGLAVGSLLGYVAHRRAVARRDATVPTVEPVSAAGPDVVEPGGSAFEPQRSNAAGGRRGTARALAMVRALMVGLSALVHPPRALARVLIPEFPAPLAAPWRAHGRPRVARMRVALRRCMPVRGPDRSAFRRPFPGVAVLM